MWNGAQRWSLGVLRHHNPLYMEVRFVGRLRVQMDDMIDSLLRAVLAGDVELVRVSLERGADPNATFDEGTDVLGAAVIAGHVQIVRMLLDAGAIPNVRRWD